MGIYDNSGTALLSSYDKDGNSLSIAYDKDGNSIWTSTPASLKVGTYNVGDWGWGAGLISADYKESYLALQNTIFTNIDADICAMQEWDAQFCTDGTLSSIVTDQYFDHFYSYQYLAIGSNLALSNFASYSYTTVSPGGDYGRYEKGYLNINGKTIMFLNVHMSTDQTTQETQCGEILDLVANESNVILCGDFNTVIHSLSDTDYITCIKPFIDAGFTDANCGAFGIFPTYYNTSDPSASYRPATDHILVKGNISIEDAYVDTTKLTDGLSEKIDHVPLVAELLIN